MLSFKEQISNVNQLKLLSRMRRAYKWKNFLKDTVTGDRDSFHNSLSFDRLEPVPSRKTTRRRLNALRVSADHASVQTYVV